MRRAAKECNKEFNGIKGKEAGNEIRASRTSLLLNYGHI